MVRALGRVTRHHIELPAELAGVSVIGRQVAALEIFAATLADEHQPVTDARRTGDGHVVLDIGGTGLPDLAALLGIDGNEAAVQRAPDDLALVEGHATIGVVAAQARGGDFARHLRVVLPECLARGGVVGVHLAPGRRHVDTAVDHHRRGLPLTLLGHVGVPGESELADGVGIDLLQGAVALFVVVAAMQRPFGGVGRAGRLRSRLNLPSAKSQHGQAAQRC